jgi:hypothetical protein
VGKNLVQKLLEAQRVEGRLVPHESIAIAAHQTFTLLEIEHVTQHRIFEVSHGELQEEEDSACWRVVKL